MLLKTCFIFLALVAQLLAVSNSVTITDTSGSTQTSRPTTTSRVFAQGEFPSGKYPQPHIAAGNIATYQVDVKNHWSDGSIKHAMISFPLTIAASSSVVVDFVQANSAASAGSALSLSGMLTFNSSNWDASTAATFSGSCSGYGASGTTCTVDPRNMIQDSITASHACGATGSNCQYWLSGPVVTQAIIEGPRDTPGSARSYDFGSDSNHSLHPIFILTFYAGQSSVKVEYVLEDCWTTSLQDQTYSLALKAGAPSLSSVFTKSSFTHIAESRWRETFWTGATIGAVNVDFNLAYMSLSKALPNFDLTKTVPGGAITSDLAAWSSSDQGAINGNGLWTKYMPQSGGRNDLGVFPSWYARWFYTMDPGMYSLLIGQGTVSGYVPFHFRESASGKFFDSGGTVNAFGHPVSIDARPTIYLLNLSFSGTQPGDLITPVGTVTGGGWTVDTAHQGAMTYIPYLVTGDWYFLEELYFQAARELGAAVDGTNQYSRHDSWGWFNDQDVQLRGTAWGRRDIAQAGAMAPDSTAEAAYFTEKVNNQLAIEEGYQNTTAGNFPPSNSACPGYVEATTTDKWCWGRLTAAQGFANPLHIGSVGNNNGGSLASGKFILSGADTPSWQEAFYQYAYRFNVMGHIQELGYPAAGANVASFKYGINVLANPAFNPFLINSDQVATLQASTGTYYATWADYLGAFSTSFASPNAGTINMRTFAGYFDHASDDTNVTDPGYPHVWKGAASYFVGLSDGSVTGQQAWNWAVANVGFQSTIGTDPQYSILPRSAPSPPPTAQSIVVSGLSSAPTYSIPNAAPFTGLVSQWIDVRIHSYSIPSGACLQFYYVGWTRIDLCDPGTSGGGVFELHGQGTPTSGNAPLISPPKSKIIAATQTNPMVLTLQQTMPAVEVSVGKTIQLWGVNDSGCSGMNALQTVTAVSGTSVTISFDGTGCAYSSGNGFVYGQDILVRVSYNQSNNTMGFESWNVDGTGRTSMSAANSAVSSWSSPTFPYTNTLLPTITAIGDIAYIRWCAGVIAPGSAPPQGSGPSCSGAAILADWEFDGNGNDSGPNSLNTTPAGSGLYVDTPVYVPGCFPGASSTFRAGAQATLNGGGSVPLNGGSTLTYAWQQLGSTEPGLLARQPGLIWANQNTATPSMTGTIAGPLNVQLTVTDSSGQSSVCALHNGVVATDAAGNVVVPSDPTGGWDKISKIIGPVLAFSAPSVRWPFQQQATTLWADAMGQSQGQFIPGAVVDDRTDGWNTSASGTVSMTNGSQTVTGSSTHFQQDFCGGSGHLVPSKITPTSNKAIQTGSYSVLSGDTGMMIPFNCSSACSVTMPAASAITSVFVLNENPTTALTVLNLAVSPDPDPVLGYGQWLYIVSDGTTLSVPKDAQDPRTGIAMVGWYSYTLNGVTGDTGRRANGVGACPSDTALILTGLWVPPTESGMHYAVWTNDNIGSWINGGANIDYYDNKLGFYTSYLATGIDTYLHNARWLADRWWTMPYVDRGNANDCESNPSLCANGGLFPRIYGWSGVYLRAIDQDILAGSAGSSPMWLGIRQQTDGVFRYGPSLASLIGDLRETAYQHMFVALCAAYDPDSTHADACRVDVAGLITGTWQPARRADGHWEGFVGDYSSVNNFQWNDIPHSGQPGTVTVGGGSPSTVTITGGTFTAGWFPRYFFSLSNWNDASTYDTVLRTATYVDSTHLSISPSYSENCASTGNSCSGRSWVLGSNWNGFGTQPFMLGIAGHWFNQAYLSMIRDCPGGPTCATYASQAALAKSYVVDAATWISHSATDGTGGTDPLTRGAYYGVGFGVCTPGVSGAADGCRCGTGSQTCDSTSASRENGGEAIGELALAYLYSPSPTLLSQIDDVYGACYGKSVGDPGHDVSGTYCTSIDTFYIGTLNPKWFGFFFGMGRNGAYLSARQGGVAPASNRTIQIPFRLANIPNAAKVRITITQPNAAAASTVCTSSPCAITVDSRQGRHLYQMDYLSSSNAVLAGGDPLPLYVPQ